MSTNKVKSIPSYSLRLVKDGVSETNNPYAKCSTNAFDVVKDHYRDLPQEEFGVLFLNRRNRILAQKLDLFRGSICESVVSPREVFAQALLHNANRVILIHNHPSGDPSPSREDQLVTTKLATAGKFLDITVLDHIIVGDDTYYSFADQGMLLEAATE